MQKSLSFLILTFLCSTGSGTSVRPVNLLEMIELADRVFQGTCLSVSYSVDARGIPVAEYSFRVERGLKGVETGRQIEIRQVSFRNGFGITGLPQFQKGERVLLFLHGTSALGLTSPVGLDQGIFHMVEGGGDQALMMNGVNNRNLALGLTPAEADALGLTGEELTQFRSGGPVSLGGIARAVQSIEVRNGQSNVKFR